MKIVIRLALVIVLLSGSKVMAQADLFILQPNNSPVRLSDISTSSVIRNLGTVVSDPFRVKMWVSADNVFDDTDNIVISDVIMGLQPYAPPSSNEQHFQSINFKFPLPGVPRAEDTRPYDFLNNDTRTPFEWMGKRLYVQACIAEDTVNYNKCRDWRGGLIVIPPKATIETASRGTNTDHVEVTWRATPLDSGNQLVSFYRITERVGAVSREIDLNPNDIETFTTLGQVYYRYNVSGGDPGIRYSYVVQACYFDGTTGFCPNGGGLMYGNILANFTSSEGTFSDHILVNWDEFRKGTPLYRVIRCDEPNASNCINTQLPGTRTSYQDSNVVRGQQYSYTIEACDRSSGDECHSNQWYKTGVTNPGFLSMVDIYEDDDTVNQATLVDSSDTQIHSFDTADDQDWVKLVLDRAQSVRIYTDGFQSSSLDDTELTLYDTDLNEIDYNDDDPDRITGYSALSKQVLEAGVYYLKVNQYELPPFIFFPISKLYA